MQLIKTRRLELGLQLGSYNCPETIQRWLRVKGIQVKRCPSWVYDWAYWRRKSGAELGHLYDWLIG